MSELSQRVTTREQMLHEENIRLNREHALLVELAPELWNEFKAAFRNECWEITRHSSLVEFRVDEQDSVSFDVLRRRSYSQFIAVQSFAFKPSLPGISWRDGYNKKPAKIIGIALDVSSPCLVMDGKSVILSRFVADRLEGVCL